MLRSLIQQAFGVLSVRVIGTVLALGVTILIARLWSPSALGIYSYVVVLIALVSGPTTNGWSVIILRETARHNKVSREVATLAANASLFSALIAIIAAIAAYLLIVRFPLNDVAVSLQPIGMIVAILIGAVIFLDQLSSIRMAKLRGVNRPIIGQMPETLIRPAVLLISLALVATLAQGGPQHIQLFVCLISASLLAMVVGEVILRRLGYNNRPTQMPQAKRRGWIASALTLGLTGGLIQLNGYTDILILGMLAPAEEIGFYRAALQIAMLSNFGFMALNFIAGQRFSRLIETGDRESLTKSATYFARLAFVSAVPMPIILIVAGDLLFPTLFGPEFGQSVVPAILLTCGFTVNAACGMPYTMLVMQQSERIGLGITFVSVCANAILCLTLIPHFGLLGAAIGNFAGVVLWVTALWLVVLRKFGIDMSVLGLKSAP